MNAVWLVVEGNTDALQIATWIANRVGQPVPRGGDVYRAVTPGAITVAETMSVGERRWTVLRVDDRMGTEGPVRDALADLGLPIYENPYGTRKGARWVLEELVQTWAIA